MSFFSGLHHHHQPSPFAPQPRSTQDRSGGTTSYALGTDGMETPLSVLYTRAKMILDSQNLALDLFADRRALCEIRVVRFLPNPPDKFPLDWVYKQAIILCVKDGRTPINSVNRTFEYHHVNPPRGSTYPMDYQCQTYTNVSQKGLKKDGKPLNNDGWMSNIRAPEISSTVATFEHEDIQQIRSVILSVTVPTRKDMRTDVDWTHDVLARLKRSRWVKWQTAADGIVERLRALGGNHALWEYCVYWYDDLPRRGEVPQWDDPVLLQTQLNAGLSERDFNIIRSSEFRKDLVKDILRRRRRWLEHVKASQ